MYIWERKGWPNFTWNNSTVARLLAQASKEQGRLLGKMEGLGFEHRGEAHLHILTEDVVKTSEIEGETLARDQVRSSIARRLGMDVGGLVQADRDVEGIVEVMLDATGNVEQPSRKTACWTGTPPCSRREEAACEELSSASGETTAMARCRSSPDPWVERKFITGRHPLRGCLRKPRNF
jgi:hypothetical protein